jgi:hypothetical protein
MPSWTKGLLAFALASACAWIVLPGDARAQDFPCNGTPGEYVVGFSGAGGGVNTSGQGTPICRAPAAGAAPAAAPPQPRGDLVFMPFPRDGYNTIDSYLAVASHRSTNDLWVTWNQRSPDLAESIVLQACAATFGEPCEVNRAGVNISVAVGRDPAGQTWFVGGEAGEEQAVRNLRDRCATCQVLKIYSSTPWQEANFFSNYDRTRADQAQTRQGYDFPTISRVPPPRAAAK